MDVRVSPSTIAGSEKILTQEAINFVAELDQKFHETRKKI